MADADDAVQSAFFSFWKRAERGDFSCEWNRNDVWNLLAKITVRKSLNQVRNARAAQRGGGRVMGEEAFGDENSFGPGLDQALAQMPVQDFDLCIEDRLDTLDDELQVFALLKMMDYTIRHLQPRLHAVQSSGEQGDVRPRFDDAATARPS